MAINQSLTIRRASADDALGLLELAELDSAPALTGEVLVAEVDGELWAAIELDGGRAVADPFRPSGQVADLLRLRAWRLGSAGTAQPGSLLRRYATRWGYSASTSWR